MSSNHQLYTYVDDKVALKCLDDKRFWIGSNKSYAYGHKDIPIQANQDVIVNAGDDSNIDVDIPFI